MPDVWGLAAVAVTFGLYVGVLTSVGLIWCRVIFAEGLAAMDGPLRRAAGGFAALGVAMACVGFALGGAMLMDALSGMTDPAMLGLLWETPPGTALRLRLLGLGLLLLGAMLGARGLWVAALGGLIALWSFCEVGHVARQDRIWVQAVLAVHLAAAAFWIGILLPLRRLSLGRDLAAAAHLGHRFGRIALMAVPLLIAAGAIMTWRIVGSAAAMTGTAYGQFLLAKLAAVGALLTLAAWNKLRLVPALRQGAPGAGARLRKSISLEAVCFGIIFVATAIFTSVLTVPS